MKVNEVMSIESSDLHEEKNELHQMSEVNSLV